jgi:ribosomal protein S18 acetylase RimI-like enzyme
VQILVRRAASQDRDFLWWLHRETMRKYIDMTWGWDEEWQRTRFDDTFDPETSEVIESDLGPIGCISVKRGADEILLARIEIAPEYQNRGIGAQIIRELLSESDRKRLPARLFVLKVNPARRLYERLGFRCVEETPTHYVMMRRPES